MCGYEKLKRNKALLQLLYPSSSTYNRTLSLCKSLSLHMQKPCLLRMHTIGSIAQGMLCLLGVYALHIGTPIKVCLHVCFEALSLLTKALWSSTDCLR